MGNQTIRDSAPIVLVLHGLEGSTHSAYMLETFRQLARQGLRAVGMNFRSCSGEMNRLPRLYHSGETGDLALALNWLNKRFPDTPLGVVGFSLGGNVLLKYLGEAPARIPSNLQAAAAVSPPFDLSAGDRVMSRGWSRFYLSAFLRRLKWKVRRKTNSLQPHINIQAALKARNFYEFDNAVTAPLHGFQDASDYYARSSCGQFISGIDRSTLVIRSLDDPFFDPTNIPHQSFIGNVHTIGVFPNRGGHVGFVEGNGRFWAERQTAKFIAKNLGISPVATL